MQQTIVAVFGSRGYPNRTQVEQFIDALWRAEPYDIIVSGGADGVDKIAESRWLAYGGQVVSFRPLRIEDFDRWQQWAIQKWHLGGPHPSVRIMDEEPTWADFHGAATYRNMLIAEIAHKGVAFHSGGSGGTASTIDAFVAEKKDCYIYEHGSPNVRQAQLRT